MSKRADTELARLKRHRRIRRRVQGTPERPRLNVYRSLQHIYAQLIDDTVGRTLLAVSTLDAQVRPEIAQQSKTEQAEWVGKVLAKRALEKGVKQVVFDRGGYKYHGRVKALAEGARAEGLQF
ncbi:MAG: 50S ribosomal protein L18 [Anaerolineales bacterium]|nr:MAG: 50S ribosomal protein L18 [Anaerolineales bacterium]